MTEKGISAPANKSAPSSAKDAFEISNSPNKLVAAASSENNIISSQSSLTEDYYDCQVAEEEDLRGGGGQVESGDTLEVSSKAVKAAAAAVVVYSTVNKQVTSKIVQVWSLTHNSILLTFHNQGS